MQEAFLHFIWQYQYFDKSDLCTFKNNSLEIFNQGFLQTNAGPDFSQARIKIADILWSGNVEIHVKSSAWIQHSHDSDKAYDNVILHVVWDNDKQIRRTDGSLIPVLELKDRVDPALINRYQILINQSNEISCMNQFDQVDHLTRLSMWDKSMMNRLERKAREIEDIYKQLDGEWETVAYRLLCRNFGFKINAEAFEMLSKSLPLKYIHKHANDLKQVEALLFGQAGFLDSIEGDEYYLVLRKEYLFLSKKYNLHAQKMNKHQWKFLRLRPSNFPTLRLAQLATLLVNLKNIFSTILETTTFGKLNEIMTKPTSDYWNSHYHFGSQSTSRKKKIGKSSVQNVIINTVVPILTSYGKMYQDQKYIDRAIEFLQKISPESNRITRQWKTIGQPIKSAFDSQASIELYNEYCTKKRCLSCNIGVKLLTNQEKMS